MTLALCAGCGGSHHDAAPRTTLLPSATPAANSSSPVAASPTPPDGGPPAEPDTAAGAAAFVRAYFAAQNTAFDTNDIRPLKAYSDSSCGPCTAFYDNLQASIAPRGHAEGGRYQLLSLHALALAANAVVVTVTVKIGPQTLIGSAGPVASFPPQGPTLLALTCLWLHGHWVIEAASRP